MFKLFINLLALSVNLVSMSVSCLMCSAGHSQEVVVQSPLVPSRLCLSVHRGSSWVVSLPTLLSVSSPRCSDDDFSDRSANNTAHNRTYVQLQAQCQGCGVSTFCQTNIWWWWCNYWHQHYRLRNVSTTHTTDSEDITHYFMVDIRRPISSIESGMLYPPIISLDCDHRSVSSLSRSPGHLKLIRQRATKLHIFAN